MPLETRKGSKWWYGRYEVGNKRFCVNLDVRIRGTPPPSLRALGDPAFEHSRGRAKAKLEQHIANVHKETSSEALIQNLHQLRYGSKIQSFPVDQIEQAWLRMPKRRRALNPRYAKDVQATLKRFMAHVQTKHPDIVEAAQVDRGLALEFLDTEDARKLTNKTWNDSLKRLRATFRFLQTDHGLFRNPFDGIKLREEDQVHRKPLTAPEMQSLIAAVANDPFCRPLIVCGLSTAMRLGDCCTLRWADVDLDDAAPSITVKTGKTGEVVCIPTSEPLLAELEAARKATPEKSEFVWPEQAAVYLRTHQLVTRKLRRVFKRAGFADEALHVTREHGMKKASLRDFHSLRTTWITEALSRGVPIETVKRISGHKTVEVVTTHYFHPDREQVRLALQATMPKMLGAGSPQSDRNSQLLAIIDGMTEQTWQTDREQLRKLVATA